jgi:hypothetical protein
LAQALALRLQLRNSLAGRRILLLRCVAMADEDANVVSESQVLRHRRVVGSPALLKARWQPPCGSGLADSKSAARSPPSAVSRSGSAFRHDWCEAISARLYQRRARKLKGKIKEFFKHVDALARAGTARLLIKY